jgi:hypothetical protein
MTLLIIAGLWLIGIAETFAQEGVDSAELQIPGDTIEFISNTAAPSVISTRQQIFSIGAGLGSAISGGAEQSGATGRYFIIHQLHDAEADKLDADIFGLGSGAGVDTIANLRLIIQGYLETAYRYAPADAALLARYVTVYNAVYRANRAYFTQRYKTPLLSNLSAGSEGLALRYDQWPGRTLMLIPLMTAASGSISAIDTSSITDSRVVEELKKDEDKGIGDRQGMVDFKERESEAADKAAQDQKKANAEEAAKIQQEEQRIAQEKAALEEQQAEGAAKTPEEEAAAREREAALAESEEALAERKAALAENQQKEAGLEAFADRKAEEAQRERASIAADQSEAITGQRPPAASPPAGVLGIRLAAASPRGIVVKVNPASGATMKTSALNQVLARSFSSVNGRNFAVAGAGDAARLIEIDAQTLESVKVGEDQMNPDTDIWVLGNDFYAITSLGGKNYLALFDTNLLRKAQSAVEVHPWSSVIFQGDKLITQSANGNVIFLKTADLSE